MSILVFACLIILAFGLVLAFGAPYLPTLKPQTKAALELLSLKPGETLLELGSGDGRVLRVAAASGLNAVGYELNPILVIISRLYTWKYRKKVKIIWGSYWLRQWPPADGIYVFLIGNYMQKLNTKVTQYTHKPVKVASFAFKIPGKKALKEKSGVFLYIYK